MTVTLHGVNKKSRNSCGTGDAFSSLISVCAVKDKNLKNSILKYKIYFITSICNKELSDGLNEINTEFFKNLF